jgi:hypothetical protein
MAWNRVSGDPSGREEKFRDGSGGCTPGYVLMPLPRRGYL